MSKPDYRDPIGNENDSNPVSCSVLGFDPQSQKIIIEDMQYTLEPSKTTVDYFVITAVDNTEIRADNGDTTYELKIEGNPSREK